MAALASLLAAGLLIWFVLLALVVAAKILRGGIRTSDFVHHRPRGQRKADPERVISLIAFPFVLAVYTVTALQADMTILGPDGRPSMPDVPEYLIALLASGNTLYLAGKFARRS